MQNTYIEELQVLYERALGDNNIALAFEILQEIKLITPENSSFLKQPKTA